MQGAYINQYANTWDHEIHTTSFFAQSEVRPGRKNTKTVRGPMRVFLVGYRMMRVGTSGLLVC